MINHGEEIVGLTETLLKDGLRAPSRSARFRDDPSVTVKAAGLVALLAALGGQGLAHIMQESNRTMSRYERVELDALIFYAVKILKVDETTLRRETERATLSPLAQDISVFSYRRARDYLRERLIRTGVVVSLHKKEGR